MKEYSFFVADHRSLITTHQQDLSPRLIDARRCSIVANGTVDDIAREYSDQSE
jgi:cellobiose phosphorylase